MGDRFLLLGLVRGLRTQGSLRGGDAELQGGCLLLRGRVWVWQWDAPGSETQA